MQGKREVKPFKKVPMRDIVRDHLKKAIASGNYEAGTRIVETTLAKELGISQSPVREALHDLKMLGLVEYRPYQGTFIKEVSVKDMRDLYLVRIGMEKVALEVVLTQITKEELKDLYGSMKMMMKMAEKNDFDGYVRYDNQFHKKIIEFSHNELLIRLWKQCNMLHWIRTGTKLVETKDLKILAKRHESIYYRIEKKDRTGAMIAIEKHLEELLEIMHVDEN